MTGPAEPLFGMLFWASALLILHVTVLYPASLLPFAALRSRPALPLADSPPTVTLVVAAYNEEEVIAEKIENSLALEYPDDRLDIVVFSDGSTDRTDEIVRSYADRGVELIRFEGRIGKTECQNRIVERIDSAFVVFSDADSMYEPDAIESLIRRFEPGVGCVVGDLKHYESERVAGESLYWRFEQLLKRIESRANTLVTGTGAIYAVRRTAYVPLPADAISDFEEPLAIVSSGKDVRFAPDAVAWEHMTGSVREECLRRARIATRSFQSGTRVVRWLNPIRQPLVAYQLVSHRGLLVFLPIAMGTLLVTAAVLSGIGGGWTYRFALAVQAVFYGLAALGAIRSRFDLPIPSVYSVPYYFVLSNLATVKAIWKYASGGRLVAWETAQRKGD